MADEFKVIETQEQLNAIIGERLSRVEKKYSEEAAGLRKEIDTLTAKGKEDASKIADLEKSKSEFEAKVKEYETASVKTRIAKEFNLPDAFASRLQGATEEELKKDAEALSKAFPKAAAPQKSTSAAGSGSNKSEDALREFARSFNRD